MAREKKTGTETEHGKVVPEESEMTIMSVEVFHIRQSSLQNFSLKLFLLNVMFLINFKTYLS